MLFELGFSMLVVSMNQPYYAKTDLSNKPEQTKVSLILSKLHNETPKLSLQQFFSPHTVLVGLFMMVARRAKKLDL